MVLNACAEWHAIMTVHSVIIVLSMECVERKMQNRKSKQTIYGIFLEMYVFNLVRLSMSNWSILYMTQQMLSKKHVWICSHQVCCTCVYGTWTLSPIKNENMILEVSLCHFNSTRCGLNVIQFVLGSFANVYTYLNQRQSSCITKIFFLFPNLSENWRRNIGLYCCLEKCAIWWWVFILQLLLNNEDE